jgi:hypothetical protein
MEYQQASLYMYMELYISILITDENSSDLLGYTTLGCTTCKQLGYTIYKPHTQN